MKNIGFAQKKVTVAGVEYTLQKIPFRSYMEINDRCTNKNGVLIQGDYMEALFKDCVVSEKIRLEHFDDDFISATQLIREIETFLRSNTNTNTDQKES